MNQPLYFSESQVDQIREGALDILEHIGVRIPREDIREKLSAKGYTVDGLFVRFDRALALEKLMSQADPSEAPPSEPEKEVRFHTYASAYSHTYEMPDGSFASITTESNAAMGRFIANAAELWPMLGVGCPGHPQDVHPELQFFKQAVNGFTWCRDFSPMEPVSAKIAPYHFELCAAMGKPVTGLPVYVASPLTIAGESFDIVLSQADKLDSVWFCSMPSLGANTPLNLVGAYAQTIAEAIGGALVYEAITGKRAYYNTNIFTFDFYAMTMPFGTPEKLLLEWTNMEIAARITGSPYRGPHATDIHTNALRAGVQATMEKGTLAMAGALRGSRLFHCSGTVGMDESFSPVQLLLDLETLEHVRRITQGMPMEDFDGDLLAEVRAGLEGSYISSDRTLDNMENYLWHSRLFNRASFGGYLKQPFPLDIDKARDLASDLMARPAVWQADDETINTVNDIYRKAEQAVLG